MKYVEFQSNLRFGFWKYDFKAKFFLSKDLGQGAAYLGNSAKKIIFGNFIKCLSQMNEIRLGEDDLFKLIVIFNPPKVPRNKTQPMYDFDIFYLSILK